MALLNLISRSDVLEERGEKPTSLKWVESFLVRDKYGGEKDQTPPKSQQVEVEVSNGSIYKSTSHVSAAAVESRTIFDGLTFLPCPTKSKQQRNAHQICPTICRHEFTCMCSSSIWVQRLASSCEPLPLWA
eukprot:scaffold1049_cov152-Skeletonema_menzelii.AAC.11